MHHHHIYFIILQATEVIGIITRKDLLPEILEHKFPELKNSDLSISDRQYRNRRSHRYYRKPSQIDIQSMGASMGGYSSDY
jgi:hypothetical protein